MNIEQLKQIANETELTIAIRTPVKLLKKDKEGNKNELSPIFKTQEQKVVINKAYEKAVNEQRAVEEKETDFASTGRNWGTQTNAIIEKEDGTEYLSYILIENTTKPSYAYESGEAVDKKVFEKFMSQSKPSSSQGVEKVVQARTVKLENIVAIYD